MFKGMVRVSRDFFSLATSSANLGTCFSLTGLPICWNPPCRSRYPCHPLPCTSLHLLISTDCNSNWLLLSPSSSSSFIRTDRPSARTPSLQRPAPVPTTTTAMTRSVLVALRRRSTRTTDGRCSRWRRSMERPLNPQRLSTRGMRRSTPPTRRSKPSRYFSHT